MVGRWWKTPCFRVDDEHPSEDKTSGHLERSFLISLGAVWRWAQNGSKGEGEETVERTSRESASKTGALATSTRKEC